MKGMCARGAAPVARSRFDSVLVPGFVLVLTLASLPRPAFAGPEPARIAQMLKEEGLVGATWMTLSPDTGIAVGTAGYRHSETREPVRPGDRFQVGSVTKLLLATAILRLVTEGRFTLETPVGELLPALRFENAWEDVSPVRVRHLLDHTAGLEYARLWLVFTSRPTPDTPLAFPFEKEPRLLHVRTKPGAEFAYSNIGYLVLGMIVERVSGMRYEQYLDEHLLKPLGLHDSSFAFVTQTGPHRDAALVMGHLDGGRPQPAIPTYLRAAAQLTTSSRDMGLLARFLMSDGTVDGMPFVGESLLRAMGRPAGTLAARAGLEAGGALGIARRDRHGALGLCHPGNTVGFRAMFCLYPAEQKAFFIAFNTDSETADYERFNGALIESLGLTQRDAEPWRPVGPDDRLEAWMGDYVRLPARFEGLGYLDRVLDVVRVSRTSDGVRLARLGATAVHLRPVTGAPYRFRAEGRTAASHVFLEDEAGRQVLSDGLNTYRRVDSAGVMALQASLAAGVAGTLGILVIGVTGLVRQRSRFARDALFVPVVAQLAFIACVALYFTQPWMRFGDPNVPAMLLAGSTLVLPFSIATGLWRSVCHEAGRRRIVYGVVLVCALQWLLVLAFWGLLPLRLWV